MTPRWRVETRASVHFVHDGAEILSRHDRLQEAQIACAVANGETRAFRVAGYQGAWRDVLVTHAPTPLSDRGLAEVAGLYWSDFDFRIERYFEDDSWRAIVHITED